MSKYCSVLLIGSTGMGKSALGNFLFNPSPEHIFHNQRITPAEKRVMQKECKVSIESCGIPEFTMNIVDTPGLNDTTAEADLKHMTEVLTEIQKLGQIQACILVVKFDSKIDAQYITTLEYYSKLLPDLFERNVFIVMTHFATDDRSEKIRELQGIDVTQMKNNVIAEVKRCSKITYDPMLFVIDSIPVGEEEMQASLVSRDAIIEYIYQLVPIKTEQILVTKPPALKSINARTILELEKEINDRKKQLERVSANSALLDKWQKLESKVTEAEKNLQQVREDLEDKDTDDLVQTGFWKHTQDRKFGWASVKFRINSQWPIKKVEKITNGNCHFDSFTETHDYVEGTVQGDFFKQTYATVASLTEKRLKYENDIRKLKYDKIEAERELKKSKKARDEFKEKHENIEQIELLRAFIDARKERILWLSKERVTIADALESTTLT